jgi:Pyruvate/2-oxoacid:ferredoxin oxidoreductase delta subunit
MSQADLALQYVCTHEKAQHFIEAHNLFWVSNCGCRENRKQCARSRMDVCLIFNPEYPGSGSGKKQVSQAEVMGILQEAQTKHLVARPYRNEARTDTDGICFCCDDCCGYFLDPSERCDKGELISETDFDLCNHCGACADVCYFKARKMNENELTMENELCYGCGLCVTVCLENCIQMVSSLN